jgi:type II secretory pathway predicted ATPase ExeA
MYEQHFGLKKRPFRANASGTDVFVGPQIATILAGLKKALAISDAIVTVSGPVGSGKTTLVNRALESLGTSHKIVRLARMRLESKDVLEYLLDELGVTNTPNGIIQKFAFFQRRLKELEINNTRVFIAVEDTSHLGTETLAELEALTAADAGSSGGASIVLMGDDGLEKLLLDAKLLRLKHRIRHRYEVAPLCAAELRGYLRHCFRLAGGDFEQLFDGNAAPLLHHVAGGILRTTNNLIDSAMSAARDQGLTKVPSELLARISENEFGLSAKGFDLTAQPAPLPILKPEPVAAPTKQPPAVASASMAPQMPAPAVVPVVVPVVIPEPVAEVDIPEFIQDTLPDLAILAPALAVVKEEPFDEPEIATPKIAAESDGDDVPAWDRDPTVAELRPDIEALEAALAFGKNDNSEAAAAVLAPAPKPQPKIPDVIPEITLDHAISQRIANNLIDEPGEISAPAPAKAATPSIVNEKPAYNQPPKSPRKADAELEKIAAELAKAKSLEDVDDRMAETLFGDEINFVAAQFMANPPRHFSANDDNDVDGEEDLAPNEYEAAGYEVTLETPRKLSDDGMDLSASQRLKTVRALNADLHPSLRDDRSAVESPTPASIAKPESIEDQINTSMTQTLKALNVRPPVNNDDMDDDESRRGFFSRFKRS